MKQNVVSTNTMSSKNETLAKAIRVLIQTEIQTALFSMLGNTAMANKKGQDTDRAYEMLRAKARTAVYREIVANWDKPGFKQYILTLYDNDLKILEDCANQMKGQTNAPYRR